jgi:lipopolysaccharide exporter
MTASSKKKLILGAAWTILGRWTTRGLGLISTMILARFLLPSDYGIVSMAMLVVALLQAMVDFGATSALLRKKEVARDEIDSAWTLRLIQHLLIATLILILSPFSIYYFHEPRVQYVLWAVSVCIAVSGAGNIGMVLAQRNFQYSLEFKLNLIGKVLGVVTSVVLAYYLRDYRALVGGMATGYLSGCVLSYVMHPYRPRWNTSKISEIWAITKWLMFAGVGGQILRRGDEFIAARMGTSEEFGLYSVGSDFGQMPTAEVGPAMLRALLPVLASMKGSIEEVNAAVLKTLSTGVAITLPIGLGFAAIAVPVTKIVLGENWLSAAPFVAGFSLVATISGLASPLNVLLLLRGKTATQSAIAWTEFVVFVLAAAILMQSQTLIGLVWARILSSSVGCFATLMASSRYCDISLYRAIAKIARPMVSSICMYFVVVSSLQYMGHSAVSLAVSILTGVSVYIILSLATWEIAKRPDGLEKLVFDSIRRLYSMHRNAKQKSP